MAWEWLPVRDTIRERSHLNNSEVLSWYIPLDAGTQHEPCARLESVKSEDFPDVRAETDPLVLNVV